MLIQKDLFSSQYPKEEGDIIQINIKPVINIK